MKIGILTHPLETNYGGLLQAFALQKVLRDMGHEVLTIDRHNKEGYPNFFIHSLSYVKRLIERHIKGKEVSTCWNPFIDERTLSILAKNTQAFVNRNIRLTRRVWSSELYLIDKEYNFDAYVVGSDQVWLPSYCPSSFLDFVNRDGVIKIFYAASCGKTSFADNETLCRRCMELAQSFSGISVREENLLKLSKERLNIDAEWVLDPTLLLTPKDYLDTITKEECNSDIFAYILDMNDEKASLIDNIKIFNQKEVYYANIKKYYAKGVSVNIDQYIFPSVDSWLNHLNSSSFIITDSFHGTVMAILFNKPFVTICNNKRGADRLKSLLRMFGIEDRLVDSKSDLKNVLTSTIDYNNVNEVINKERIQSLAFLENHLQ